MFKKVFNEFKSFAMRGNMIDMAVGIIIGSAFSKIVDSLVKDVIMPPICILLGKIDLENWFLVIKRGKVPAPYDSLLAAKAAGAVTLNLGEFVNSVVNFTIIAFCVFLFVKLINSAHLSSASTKSCPYCKSSISAKAVKCPCCTSEISGQRGGRG